MKAPFLFPILFIIVALSACSRCYECEIVRYYNNLPDTIIEDVCTATGEELNDLEDEGYTCAPSGL